MAGTTSELVSAAAGAVATQALGSGFRWWSRWRRKTIPTVSESESDAVKLANEQLMLARMASQMAMDMVGVCKADVDEMKTQVQGIKAELAEARCEQSRVSRLFRQAVEALRDFADIARTHDIAAPEISDELKAEIEKDR